MNRLNVEYCGVCLGSCDDGKPTQEMRRLSNDKLEELDDLMADYHFDVLVELRLRSLRYNDDEEWNRIVNFCTEHKGDWVVSEATND